MGTKIESVIVAETAGCVSQVAFSSQLPVTNCNSCTLPNTTFEKQRLSDALLTVDEAGIELMSKAISARRTLVESALTLSSAFDPFACVGLSSCT